MKTKKPPQQVRLDEDAETQIRELADKTGLPVADLIRRCVYFSLPKFVAGDANLLDFGRLQPSDGSGDGKEVA